MNLRVSSELLSAYSPQQIQQAIKDERLRRSIEEKRSAVAHGATMSLYEYVEQAWHVLEPETVFVGGWAIRAVCEHLEAVSTGRFLDMGLLNLLLVNIPPGTMKSLLVSVFWPSWEWGPFKRPHLSYLATSYSDQVATRDTRKMRNLVESEWWQERWGKGTESDVYLTRRGETSFENNKRGWRETYAFTSLTGGRADRVIVDDPHSTEQAESELERVRTTRIFRESLHSRVNDPKRSAIIIIMQRLHPQDVSGWAITLGRGYIHLMLPMEFEVARACATPIFRDPRTEEGELLFPERFPREVVEREKKTMTAFAVAGQYQQRPGKREGNMFKRHWFKRIVAAPMGVRWVRAWDLAATEEKFSQSSTAQTAGVLMGKDAAGTIYVADCVAERLENHEPLLKNTGQADRAKYFPYEIELPQDPGQAGKIQKKALARLLGEFNVRFSLQSGDKESRAEPFAAQCEVGNVYIVTNGPTDPPWVEPWIDELCLAQNTAVVTMRGELPISEVQHGDMVMTRRGWRKVLVSRLTNPKATLCQITLNNGTQLLATPNHPILVPGFGFVRAGQLKVGDALLRFTGVSRFTSILNLIKRISQDRWAAKVSNSIITSGSAKLAQSHWGITSITRMRIRQRMTATILSAFPLANMPYCITHGIDPRQSRNEPASSAAANMIQPNSVDLSHAPRFVETNGNWPRAIKIFTIAIASSVWEVLSRSTQRSVFVADLVVQSISTLPGEHPVFNLEVEGVHEFVAGGVLVHNCAFPGGALKDRVDASSAGYARLLKPPRLEQGTGRSVPAGMSIFGR